MLEGRSWIQRKKLNAHAMAGDRECALAAGCDEFDTKPIDFDRLVQKIRNLVGL